MIKFLVLIVEAIFFLTIGLLYCYAPESSYFWNDGFGGSMMFSVYDDMSIIIVLLTSVFIFFNILVSWFGLIKKINRNLASIIYMEIMVVIAMIPGIFAFYKFGYGEDMLSLMSVALMSAIFSLILLHIIRKDINQKMIISFLTVFTIVSIVLVLFLIFAMAVSFFGSD